MSSPAPTVVAPNGTAASVVPMKGGVMLSPLPLSGARRRSRKLSKKARKALKMMKKMGGDEMEAAVGGEATGAVPAEVEEAPVGARRRRSRKGTKKGGRRNRTKKHSFLY